MLKPEEARRRLAEVREPEWVERRVARLGRMPMASPWIHSRIGGLAPPGRLARQFRVSKLSDDARREFFVAMFPKLEAELEAAWQAVARAPYQRRWYGSTFRAPRHAELVAAQRDEWIGDVAGELAKFDPDAPWLAAWGGHMGSYGGGIRESTRVLSASLDLGGPKGDEVFEILKQSATNQHEIGVMGQHVIRAMLDSGRPEAWSFIEKLLIAAQRQEGLRQSILESVDHAHPVAFRRMLKLIVDENLVRFSATVRAIDVWFGLMLDAASTGHARSIIERVAAMLDDRTARAKGMAGKDAETAYLALWCEAFDDAQVAEESALRMLKDRSAERRWVAVHILDRLGLATTFKPLVEMIDDVDLRVAARAVETLGAFQSLYVPNDPDSQEARDHAQRQSLAPEVFERLHRLLHRMTDAQQKFEPLAFPWSRASLNAEEIGSALVEWTTLPNAQRLTGLLGRFNSNARQQAAWLLSGRERLAGLDKPDRGPISPTGLSALLELLGDPAREVRTTVGVILAEQPVSDNEAARHEELLGRASSDVRTRALDRLLKLSDERVLDSARRLLDGSAHKRTGGLGLLRAMVEKDRSVDAARTIASAFAARVKKPGKDLLAALDAVLATNSGPVVSVDDAFGLAKAFAPRPVPVLRNLPPLVPTPAACAVIRSLDELVGSHRHHDLRLGAAGSPGTGFDEGESPVLGSLCSSWRYEPRRGNTREQDRARCPVLDVLGEWLRDRPPQTREADGLDLVRAWAVYRSASQSDRMAWPEEVIAGTGRNSPQFIIGVGLLLDWALRLEGACATDFFLDLFEGAIERGEIFYKNWSRVDQVRADWTGMLQQCPANWERLGDIACIRRLDGLLRAANQRHNAFRRSRLAEAGREYPGDLQPYALRLDLGDFLRLWEAGDICDDELLLRLVRTQPAHEHDTGSLPLDLGQAMRLRKRVPGRPGSGQLSPRLDALLERLRLRVLELELARGDAFTPATPHAMAMDPSGGTDAAIGALAALGSQKLVRGGIHNDWGKAASLSTIIRHSRPGPDDTPEAFKAAAKAAGLDEQRLVELAMYQPRWAAHVERANGWPGLEEGVLWIHSHTKEARDTWSSTEDIKEPWESRSAELTPIPPDRLADGAVDRAWFERCYKRLGRERWEVLYDAAKYASGSNGHTRARLFTDAMLGNVSERDLVSRVTAKRQQDAARALGLLAIKAGDAGRRQVLARFKVLQEMRRTSRKHGGSMLQASEKRAVEIGMENLAWTAGYPDPLRLQWAMEIEEFGDLAKGPVVVKVGEATVTLAVDDDGTPSLTCAKGGKELKSVPPAVKKDKKVEPLAGRMTELRRQRSRIRLSLEQAMCRGDEFGGGELGVLFGHPLLKSMLSRLVMVGTSKAGAALIGYPDKEGKALRSYDGMLEPLRATDVLRIAHPLDLLATKRWHEWQKECFRGERVQPFKQVFREVYVPTAAELEAGSNGTRRYAGQQVQPRQALALFGTRGWVARPEEGVQRTFHADRLTVHVDFEEAFFTPAEIEGLTLAGVSFSKAGAFEGVRLADVPSRVFSEVMRDLDLVVSVAHRGGVDPEASHSTVEMRAALLRETAELLSLKNVRIDGPRALIQGEFSEYVLHLGSGTIHLLPGGALWVIAVHSQHRGRLFLPFADDDPKTAEIVSKALLLARDREIQDPSILAQLRGR